MQFILLIFLLIPLASQAQNSCGSTSVSAASLDKGYSFITNQGVKIVLTSMLMKKQSLAQDPDIQQDAVERLTELLSHTPLKLEFSKMPRKRTCFAQVVNAKGQWVQQVLLEEGLAFAAHKPSVDKYFPLLIETELAARMNRRGVWEYEADIVVPAESLQQTSYDNGYRIIEGHIRYVRDRARRIYACMSDDPYKSVCLLVARNTYFEMKNNGFDLFKEVGTKIRVRGDLFPRNGLKMVIDRPQLIEIRS